ncbi:MAG: SpoIIE family protein phosphatase [Acidobacteria bacterium]|nr:SpoIIE family protein phosphatase [Acidobacteriota bacterium]
MKLLISGFLLLAGVLWADEFLSPLGQAFHINTPWKAQAGDDPRAAQPDFDDSSWGDEQALAHMDGFAWYRMTVRVPDVPGPYGLWIPRVLKAAEFFVNGQKVGQHGSLEKWYVERRDLVDPMPLPTDLRGGDILHIAVRVKRTVSGPGIAGQPVFGAWPAVAAEHQLALMRAYRDAIVSIFMSIIVFGTVFLALVFWQGRLDRIEALWVGAILLSYLFGDLEAYRGLGLLQGWTLLSGSAMVFSLWGAWRFFNGSPSLPWKVQAPYLAMLGALLLFVAMGRMELFPWTYAVVSLSLANLLMLIRNGIDARRRSRKGEVWVLWFFAGYLLATLGAVAFYASVIQRLLTASQVGISNTWNFMQYPFRLDLRNVGEIISGGIMVGILARRLYLLLQEKQTLAAELEAAKQVQDLLLPGAETATAGFAVESAYLPARQVGGDFYFVHPLPGGRLLVVVGDVSGKGLRAAMLVSVVVGILRTAAATSAAAVLQALNAGLVGRTGGGFVTACSVIFEADGAATIANAGHCPVYRDGLEVAMEPNLPLGVVAEATFDEVMAPPGLFVLLSDGVVEAENAQRELFGFERTLNISHRPAREIATAAQSWGQTDDITVVSVRRNP